MKKIAIELTHNCNLSCSFCYRLNVDTKNNMSFDKCCELLKLAYQNNIKIVSFSGFGESPLHPDFINIIEYACSLFELVVFSTNGLIFTDSFSRLFLEKAKGNIVISFSLTGSTPEVYKDFQGYGKQTCLHEKIVNNIKNFINLKNNYSHDIKVNVKYMLSEPLMDDFKNYINYWYPLVDDITVSFILSIFGLNGEIAKRKGYCREISNPLFIHADGDVSACCHDCFKKVLIGNVFNEDLSEIFQSAKLKEIKASNTNNKMGKEFEICSKCDFLQRDIFFNDFSYKETEKYRNHPQYFVELNGKNVVFCGANQRLQRFLMAHKLFFKEVNFEYSIVDYSSEVMDLQYFADKVVLYPEPDIFKSKYVVIFDESENIKLFLGKNEIKYMDLSKLLI